MPAKNVIKRYLKNGYYHIYNRGVEKRNIFEDDQDYKVFLRYLKEYLEPKDKASLRKKLADPKISWKEKDKFLKLLALNNFYQEIDLVCFCLMPNHFHFLVKQKSLRGIEVFMKSFATRYVMYFNKKHDRVGGLFQDAYKAVLVSADEQLLHLTRYIHLNPFKNTQNILQVLQGDSLQNKEYKYSSLPAYLGRWRAKWLSPGGILSYFEHSRNSRKIESYREFLSLREVNHETNRIIGKLSIDY